MLQKVAATITTVKVHQLIMWVPNAAGILPGEFPSQPAIALPWLRNLLAPDQQGFHQKKAFAA